MQVVYPCCCGLDVHKKSITACVLWVEARGEKRKEKRVFGTFTRDLLKLSDWLRECGVRQVAMESTGIYWKPVWNILEGQFEILLVNAQHIKAVPGRKTDQEDSEWIADLLQHGLLKGSFVPPSAIRELRDLTRYRVNLQSYCESHPESSGRRQYQAGLSSNRHAGSFGASDVEGHDRGRRER